MTAKRRAELLATNRAFALELLDRADGWFPEEAARGRRRAKEDALSARALKVKLYAREWRARQKAAAAGDRSLS